MSSDQFNVMLFWTDAAGNRKEKGFATPDEARDYADLLENHDASQISLETVYRATNPVTDAQST